jgi:hypothetical protein
MAGGVGLEALNSTSSWESLCSFMFLLPVLIMSIANLKVGIKMLMFSACPMEVKDASVLIGLSGLDIERPAEQCIQRASGLY